MAGIDWLRLWHDMPNDPKWRTIARISGQPVALVISVYVHLMVDASRNVTRGHTDVTNEDIASALDVTDDAIASIRSAMQGRVLEGDELTGWDNRQPKKEDAGNPETGAKSAAQRKREQRERQKSAESQAEPSSRHDESRDVTESHDREEKSREDKTNTSTNVEVVASHADDQSPQRPKLTKTQCPHRDIVALYHELLPANPSIRDWTPARAEHLRVRWNEDTKRQTLDWWRRFFEYIAQSEFLTGRATAKDRKPFTPGLDWIVKAENFAKIREGRFHDQEAA
ncbi:hypothetical protein [Pandoraea apista]|uniref:hypothetical protein n=1 Tax=Pandoraea apista TaxID=93218 RepID=UPI002F92DEE1